jgi:polysaccharide biosynthesis protein PslG
LTRVVKGVTERRLTVCLRKNPVGLCRVVLPVSRVATVSEATSFHRYAENVRNVRLLAIPAACIAAAIACSGGAPKSSLAGPAAGVPSSASSSASPGPTPSYPVVLRAAIGMHWLQYPSPLLSRLRFGAVRFNGGNVVTWPILQPSASSRLDSTNPAVRQLDDMVSRYEKLHVEPLIVLGGTPSWAAEACQNGTWPADTCAPARRDASSPWGTYVRFLAHRYPGASFEIWNEPNLRNGYNDTIGHLAEMQRTASAAIHSANPHAVVVSPSVGITAGDPLGWFSAFLREPGGGDFDVAGVHLYASDASARAGDGPEWADGMFRQFRSLLNKANIRKPIWNTEVNVGRFEFRNTTSRVFTGSAGAAMVARTFLLQLGDGVSRVYWYAGDDRSWSGTWLVNGDGKTLTPAGVAFNVAYRMLVGATPHGCSTTAERVWTCRFTLPAGRSMEATWTTGLPTDVQLPPHTLSVVDVTGRTTSASSATLHISDVPTFVVSG